MKNFSTRGEGDFSEIPKFQVLKEINNRVKMTVKALISEKVNKKALAR